MPSEASYGFDEGSAISQLTEFAEKKKKKVLKSSQDDQRGQNESGRDGLWADSSGPFNCCPDGPREGKTKALITIMQTCHQEY